MPVQAVKRSLHAMWEPSRNSFGLATTTSSKQSSLSDFVKSVDRAAPDTADTAAAEEAGSVPVATAVPQTAAAPAETGFGGGGAAGDSAAELQSPTMIGTPLLGGSGGTDPGTARSGSVADPSDAVDAMISRKRSREELASGLGESTPMIEGTSASTFS